MNRRSFLLGAAALPAAATAIPAVAASREGVVITDGFARIEAERLASNPVWIGIDGRYYGKNGPRAVVAKVWADVERIGVSVSPDHMTHDDVRRDVLATTRTNHVKRIGIDDFRGNELVHQLWGKDCLPVCAYRPTCSFTLPSIMALVMAQPSVTDEKLHEEWSRTEVHTDRHGRGVIVKKDGPHSPPIDRVKALEIAVYLMMVGRMTWETAEGQRRVEVIGANQMMRTMLGDAAIA